VYAGAIAVNLGDAIESSVRETPSPPIYSSHLPLALDGAEWYPKKHLVG
jgi:hypothetical protein